MCCLLRFFFSFHTPFTLHSPSSHPPLTLHSCRLRVWRGLYDEGEEGVGVGPQARGAHEADRRAWRAEPVKNPRLLFAERIDAVWTDLGASEVRQESLKKPPNIDLIDLNRIVRVQQHPALYEEGEVLFQKKTAANRETFGKISYEFEDDGLKVLSSQDYVDLRVTPFENLFAARAESICWRRQIIQFFIFILTSLSTLLGALTLMQYIPVALALGSAMSSLIAYQDLESRMERVNNANVSLRKLIVWWHALSVIEKRIPSNKVSPTPLLRVALAVPARSMGLSDNAVLRPARKTGAARKHDGEHHPGRSRQPRCAARRGRWRGGWWCWRCWRRKRWRVR